MALVNSGNTYGSLNILKHAMGPRLLYNLRNLCNAEPFSSRSTVFAIRITTSGDNNPWAVWKEGRVSLGDNTDVDMAGKDVLDFLGDEGVVSSIDPERFLK